MPLFELPNTDKATTSTDEDSSIAPLRVFEGRAYGAFEELPESPPPFAIDSVLGTYRLSIAERIRNKRGA